MLAPPCRAEGVALIHGAAIEEIAGDAAIGVQPALNFARRERARNGGGREQNIAQELCVAGRDRFARGGHCIEGASEAAVDVGGLNQQHAMSIGAARLRDLLGELEVDLRSQVAREAANVG
jgi:hypothetical protein